jgi:integrase
MFAAHRHRLATGDDVESITNRLAILNATGSEAFLPRVADHVEEYVSSRVDLRPKTRQMIRKSLALLLAHVGDRATVAKLTRKAIIAWSDAMALTLKPATVNRRLSEASQFWQYLQTRSIVGENERNPFAGQRKRDTSDAKRQPFTIEELNALLAPSPLRLHIAVGLTTGMRVSEIVAAEVKEGAVFIAGESDGKTPAARRVVPVPTLLRAFGWNESKWSAANVLLADTVVEDFIAHRRALGIGAPAGERSDKTFHSLRHNWTNAAESSGLSRSQVAAILVMNADSALTPTRRRGRTSGRCGVPSTESNFQD